MPHPRKHQRLPAAYRAQLESSRPPIGVWIKDVSSTGLKILGAPAMEPGTQVILSAGDIRLSGVARWYKGDRAGVEFDTPISAEEMNAIRHLRVRRMSRGRADRQRFKELR